MRGLTLLEIIVVIAIMLLLCCLAIPVLSGQHEGARRAACANNLSQIGKALILYSDAQSNGSFPSNKANGRGEPLPSLGMLYRDYVSDYRVFSCASRPTIKQLAALAPTTAAMPCTHPLTAAMTHYGYDPGNSGTNSQPHTPTDSMAVVVADFTAQGHNSDNHGANAGQNCLHANGSVEWSTSIANGAIDSDITSDGNITDKKLRNLESFISQ